MSRRVGFTLFELLLVLALLSLLAGVTLPALASWRDRIALDRATHNLVHAVQTAKRRSLESGEERVIFFRSVERSLVVGPTVNDFRPNQQLRDYETFSLDEGLTVEFRTDGGSRLDALKIRPLGKLPLATIRITDPTGQAQRTYHIDRLTGTLRITRNAS